MNRRNIIGKLKDYAETNPRITAMFALGSYARRELNRYSDIDLVIISSTEPTKIFREVKKLFGQQVRYDLTESFNKKVLFLGNQLLRLDLIIAESPSEVKTLFKGSRISDPSNAVIIDKSNSLKETFGKWISEPSGNLPSLINDEIEKFLISFESASAAVKKKDVFQSYFQYNLSLTRLMRLIQLERGEDYYLYSPKHLFERLPPKRRDRLSKLNGVLNLREISSRIKSLAHEFRESHIRLFHMHPGVSRTPDDVLVFLEQIQTRDLGP